MYGPAADTVRELVRAEAEGWEDSRWPNGVLSPRAICEVSYPRATVGKMRELLAQARAEAAGDQEVLQHLDYFATPFPDFFAEFESVIEGKGARSVVAKKVAEKPTIDGRLDEAAWREAAATSMVASDGTQEIDARYATSVQAVWTADGITFGFRMEEPAPQSLVRVVDSRDDSMAWWDDCIEIFVDVTGENQGDWYQFILNANCAIYDGHGQDTSWNAEGVEAAAHVGDGFWTLEAYVPYSTFPEVKTPGTGIEWYAQFTRHRIADSKDNPESAREVQRLNYRFGGPSRNLADFAPLRFAE